MNLPSPCMSPSLLNPPRRVAQDRRHSKIDAWTLGEVLHQFERPPSSHHPTSPFPSASSNRPRYQHTNLHESALDAKNDVVVILTLTWCQTREFRRSLRKIHRGRTETKHLVDAMFPASRHPFLLLAIQVLYMSAVFQSLWPRFPSVRVSGCLLSWKSVSSWLGHDTMAVVKRKRRTSRSFQAWQVLPQQKKSRPACDILTFCHTKRVLWGKRFTVF